MNKVHEGNSANTISIGHSPLHLHDTALEKALARAMKLCARTEKCSAQVRLYLQRMLIAAVQGEQNTGHLNAQEIELVLQRLVEENFIDDRRFAFAYAKDKMTLSKWGKVKVRNSLLHFGIAEQLVDEAISQASASVSGQNLHILLEKKMSSLLKSADLLSLDFAQKQKLYARLYRFALGCGYEYNEIKAELMNSFQWTQA